MTLEESYRYCKSVARRRAKNFYYAFLLLEQQQRASMCAIYAFMRYSDDLSDEPGANREALVKWRAALDDALAGRTRAHPALPAFSDTVDRYRIPAEYFHSLIDGMMSDLEPRRIGNFEELYRYCYQAASTVGLTTVHVFGYNRGSNALDLAEKCGVAFQLTNILRDVREDWENSRVYLPAAELAVHGVDPAIFAGGEPTEAFLDFMRFQIDRARSYYTESRPLLDLVDYRSRRALWALIEIYSRLLDRIASDPAAVLRQRVSLSTAEKVGVLARSFFQPRIYS